MWPVQWNIPSSILANLFGVFKNIRNDAMMVIGSVVVGRDEFSTLISPDRPLTISWLKPVSASVLTRRNIRCPSVCHNSCACFHLKVFQKQKIYGPVECEKENTIWISLFFLSRRDGGIVIKSDCVCEFCQLEIVSAQEQGKIRKTSFSVSFIVHFSDFYSDRLNTSSLKKRGGKV